MTKHEIREVFINSIAEQYKNHGELIPPWLHIGDIEFEVEEQEPRKGHWIKYGIPRCGEQHYQCTNCENYVNFGQWGEYYKRSFKYCPNCGADMRGEK